MSFQSVQFHYQYTKHYCTKLLPSVYIIIPSCTFHSLIQYSLLSLMALFSHFSSHQVPLQHSTSALPLTPPHTIPHFHFPSPLFTPLPPYPTTPHHTSSPTHHHPLTTHHTSSPHLLTTPSPPPHHPLTTPPFFPPHPNPSSPTLLKGDIITPKDS